MNYVEPKIRLEISRLEGLFGTKRRQRVIRVRNPSGSPLKSSERKTSFLNCGTSRTSFAKRRNFIFEPDLNDGVVLNIAPLRELVPWKEAKNYWEKLRRRKYEWSSIGKQLRQKGLVK